VSGYARKGQVRSTKIRQGLNVFNVNNKTLKSKSHKEYHTLLMEDRRIPKKMLTYNPLRR
jgi:hypothetical protein